MIGKIKEIFSELFEVKIEMIHEDLAPDDVPNWDSLNNLRLITAFEEEFNIQFSMAEIKQMDCFGKIVAVIEHHHLS